MPRKKGVARYGYKRVGSSASPAWLALMALLIPHCRYQEWPTRYGFGMTRIGIDLPR